MLCYFTRVDFNCKRANYLCARGEICDQRAKQPLGGRRALEKSLSSLEVDFCSLARNGFLLSLSCFLFARARRGFLLPQVKEYRSTILLYFFALVSTWTEEGNRTWLRRQEAGRGGLWGFIVQIVRLSHDSCHAILNKFLKWRQIKANSNSPNSC